MAARGTRGEVVAWHTRGRGDGDGARWRRRRTGRWRLRDLLWMGLSVSHFRVYIYADSFQGRVEALIAPTNTLLGAGDPTTRPC